MSCSRGNGGEDIFLSVARVSLSEIVENLPSRYTRRENKAKARVGHLFRGRYEAIPQYIFKEKLRE